MEGWCEEVRGLVGGPGEFLCTDVVLGLHNHKKHAMLIYNLKDQ